MDLTLLTDNVLSPPVLFFLLGLAATLVRSDLEIPQPLPTLFSLYLLWAIGYKGGVKLAEAGPAWSTVGPLAASVVMAAATPLWVFPVLLRGLARPDAAACAAAFGSVSAVTFITAANFLDARGIGYSGSMVAALALMEAPAIVVGVLLYRRGQTPARAGPHGAPNRGTSGGAAQPSAGVIGLLKESILSGPVFLLLGSLAVGALAGERGYEQLRPFTDDVFYGVLVLFLLDAGMVAAKRLSALKAAGTVTVAAGVLIPLVNALLALGLSAALGLPRGDAFLLMILSASASYIAVPAAMRLALPEANPGVYLTAALGITFPFNVALGIPLYLWGAGLIPPG